MSRILFFFIFIIFFCGCAKLAHLEQLLTLKAYSENKDRQAEYVTEQDERFERLLEAVKNNTLDQYSDKESFLKEFGEPIFVREVVREDKPYDSWLYRYTAQLFGSEKVYLYFDEGGRLRDWEHVAAEKQEGEG